MTRRGLASVIVATSACGVVACANVFTADSSDVKSVTPDDAAVTADESSVLVITGADAAGSDASTVTDGASELPPPGPSCVPPDAGANIVADSFAGFSGTQGKCGWSYGTIDPTVAAPTFTPLPHFDPVNLIWAPDVNNYIPQLTPTGQHPGAPQRAVRRWVSTVSGSVRLQADAYLGDPSANQTAGNGIEVLVYVGTQKIIDQTVTGTTHVVVDQAIQVFVGMSVDFEVDSIASNTFYDATGFSVTMTAE